MSALLPPSKLTFLFSVKTGPIRNSQSPGAPECSPPICAPAPCEAARAAAETNTRRLSFICIPIPMSAATACRKWQRRFGQPGRRHTAGRWSRDAHSCHRVIAAPADYPVCATHSASSPAPSHAWILCCNATLGQLLNGVPAGHRFLGPLAPGLLPRSCRFRCTCVHLLLGGHLITCPSTPIHPRCSIRAVIAAQSGGLPSGQSDFCLTAL